MKHQCYERVFLYNGFLLLNINSFINFRFSNLSMRNFAELQYQTSAHEALRIINKWSKKSENKELEELSKHIIQMVSYTAGLHVERKGYENSVEEMRNELIKAINKNNEYTN